MVTCCEVVVVVVVEGWWLGCVGVMVVMVEEAVWQFGRVGVVVRWMMVVVATCLRHMEGGSGRDVLALWLCWW